jgi:hypothetical protein
MTTIDTDSLTLKQIKELQQFIGTSSPARNHPFTIGENYLIRTVTMIVIGHLKWVGDSELIMSSASWVADTGRFHDALKTGKLNEVEPFLNDVIVGRGSIIDATVWTHKNPSEQK